MWGEALFWSGGRRTALGPQEIRERDVVYVFMGRGPLSLLRERGGGMGWTLVGEAFVGGLMKLDETHERRRYKDEVFEAFG